MRGARTGEGPAVLPSAQAAKRGVDPTVQRLLSALAEVGPSTASALCTRAQVKLTPALVRRLAEHAPVFCAQVRSSAAAALVFVGLPGKAEQALQSDDLLLSLLALPVAQGGRTRAHTRAQLRDMLPRAYRAGFAAALDRRLVEQRWPAGVGTIVSRGQPLIFLFEHAQGHAAPRPASATLDGAVPPFDQVFGAAFERLRAGSRSNLVPLSALRMAMPHYEDAAFNRALRQLREAHPDYVLQSFDGRHGELSAAMSAAAIHEGGRTYIYVARREP